MAPQPAPGVETGGPPPRRRRRRRRTLPPIRVRRRRPKPKRHRKGERGPGQGAGTAQEQISATVATPGNEGTAGPEFDTGDMTGTDDLQDSVFSQGAGFAPQLHYGRNEAAQQQTATQVASASEDTGA